MTPTYKIRLENFILGGLFAVIASWFMAGCKLPELGNKVKYDEPAPSNSGYYETAPQNLTFCATFQGADPTRPTEVAEKCRTGVNPTQVPAELSGLMTNPIVYLANDHSLRTSTNLNAGMYLDSDEDGTHMGIYRSNSGGAWLTDDRCSLRLDFQGTDGTLRRDLPPSGNFSVQTSGRFEIFFRVIRSFEGPCDTSLASMRACYSDVTACPSGGGYTQADLQGLARSTFQAWVSLGILTAADIATATAMGYEVQYQ